jgi:hypothetical protein
LDDCSHFVWTFPLRLKSDTFSTLSNFFAHVHTQFGCKIKSVQCDNGREFDNSASRAFFLANGVSLRMSCPYTSQQNGKVERLLRTLNNITRTLLFQVSMPPIYWADALATATHLLNRLPTKTLHMSTTFFALHGILPSYHDLRAFGCTCYPNLTATTPHKLAPRSTLCAFLGYSPDHKGYRCLDLTTNCVIISRHVVFDETTFPFAHAQSPSSPRDLEFLTNEDDFVQVFLPLCRQLWHSRAYFLGFPGCLPRGPCFQAHRCAENCGLSAHLLQPRHTVFSSRSSSRISTAAPAYSVAITIPNACGGSRAHIGSCVDA